MEALKRLVQYAVHHESLDPDDRPSIKDVIFQLALDLDTVEEVNEKFKGQIKLEADMVYLLGKYRDKCNDLKIELEEEEASVFLDAPKRNDEGFKTSTREFKAYQLTNPEIAVKRRRLAACESLLSSLVLLSKVVFARNDKLEQLSVNYRKELAADH